MPAAWIETPGAIIRLQSRSLEVTLPAPARQDESVTPPVDMPLAEIEHLIVAEGVRLTFPALCAALQHDIPVLIHDWRGNVLGTFLPPAGPQAAMRLQQYQRSMDSAFATAITRRLIQAKVRNQRRLLSRLHATRPRETVPLALDHMAALLAETDRAADIPALRGLEGAASANAWAAWAAFLPPDFPFRQRSTRPPRCPVNAVLSYLSSILYGEVLAACHRRGLDPGLGHLHTTADRRWSLPLDLMEPFRPAIIEATALRLFTHKMMDAASYFEARDGGIFLTPSGRRLVAEQFDRRVSRPFHSEHAGHSTTLRKQITATILSYRQALEDPSAFRPFIMN